MNKSEILEGLVELGSEDWIGLWMIVDDVEAELHPDDDAETLRITVMLAQALLARGFLAGDSPVASAVHFHAWPNQTPDAVGEYIYRRWKERGGPPDWGDAPWFAIRLGAPRHA
jgi:hypothetical protein